MTSQRKAPQFNWQDPLDLEGQLTQEERMVRDSARDYARDRLMTRVQHAFRHESTDPRFFGRWARSGCSA